MRRCRRGLLCAGAWRGREQRLQLLHLMDELMFGPPPGNCSRVRTEDIAAGVRLTPSVSMLRGMLLLLLRLRLRLLLWLL